MSADAHVLGWSMFQRGLVLTAERRSGLALANPEEAWSMLPKPS